MTQYVGIYWTRQVRWAGFTEISSDPDIAVTQSKTIAYQRALTKRFIAQNKGAQLVRELVFIEKADDRAHKNTFAQFKRFTKNLSDQTIYLWTDFHSEGNWRDHRHLQDLLAGVKSLPLPIEALEIPGHEGLFDPRRHFENWRDRTTEKTNLLKQDLVGHRERVMGALGGLEGASLAEKANALNSAAILTTKGKAWNGETLRKYLNPAPPRAAKLNCSET